MKRRTPQLAAGIILSFVVLAFAGAGLAGRARVSRGAHHVSISSGPSAASSKPGRAAQRMQIDPETGDLVPLTPFAGTPQSPEAAMSHSVRGLQARPHPAGGLSVDLEGRFMESMVAVTDSSGRTVLGCAPGGRTERTVRDGPTPPSPGGRVDS